LQLRSRRGSRRKPPHSGRRDGGVLPVVSAGFSGVTIRDRGVQGDRKRGVDSRHQRDITAIEVAQTNNPFALNDLVVSAASAHAPTGVYVQTEDANHSSIKTGAM